MVLAKTYPYHKLRLIYEENQKEIDAPYLQKVSNIGLKHAAQKYLNILKPI